MHFLLPMGCGKRLEWHYICPALHRLERLRYIEARWEAAHSGRRRKYDAITRGGELASAS